MASAEHGVFVRTASVGVRPVDTPSQSVIGVVGTAGGAAADGKFGDNAAVVRNKAHYITERPSDADIGTTGSLPGILDKIYGQGRVPVQMVIVSESDTPAAVAAADLAMTSAGITYSSAKTISALRASAGDFGVLEAGAWKYLAFKTAPTGAHLTALQALVPGVKITITLHGGALKQTFTVVSPYDAANQWVRINDDAAPDEGANALVEGSKYDIENTALAAVTDADTILRNNLVGRQGDNSGIYALEVADPTPKILCVGHPKAAGLVSGLANPVSAALAALALKMGGIAVLDGPNEDLGAAIAYAEFYGGQQIYMVDPWARQIVGGSPVDLPASPAVAGLIAVNDAQRGFWSSPSNQILQGITGTSREISHGFIGSEADVLNQNQVATIIKDGGFLLWGNESLNAVDPSYQFLQIYRTEVAIKEALRQSLRWAIARNITVRFFEQVAQSVNAYLSTLTELGAITGGECYPNAALNTPANIKNGVASFIARWSGTYPAQTINIDLELTDDFLIANLLSQI